MNARRKGLKKESGQALSPWTLSLQSSLHSARRLLGLKGPLGNLEIVSDQHSIWIIYPRPNGASIAQRACFDSLLRGEGHFSRTKADGFDYQIIGALGTYQIGFRVVPMEGQIVARTTTRLKVHRAFHLPELVRDIYCLGPRRDPLASRGKIHLSQIGPGTGASYFSFERPDAGSALYFQNLTALNDWFELTHAEPDGIVAGEWPEVGTMLPKQKTPLPARADVIVSDVLLVLTEKTPRTVVGLTDLYLEGMAAICRLIPKPATAYFDWIKLAERSMRCLATAKACGRKVQGNYYLNAYVGSDRKPPESMVQGTVLTPMLEYVQWKKSKVRLPDLLRKSLLSFHNRAGGTIERWLPGTPFQGESRSEEEDPRTMDSWYLLHILLNVGRVAAMGYEDAAKVFLASVDYAVKGAHRFRYRWPVFYDTRTFKVLKAEIAPGKGGERDIPGLYTHVMLQAWELSDDSKYLREAECAAQYLKGEGFNLLYQTNNTIFSAIALARLWRITHQSIYLEISRICVANVVARFWMWNCSYGSAKRYDTFLGVCPLHQASYLAPYEESESFAACLTYLQTAGDQTPSAIRYLLAEFMKYLLHRGRFYYPQELPAEAIAKKPKEGHIDRKLWMPLEDLRTGWQQSGQVGQEVYGSAAAFVATSRAYQRDQGCPILIFCEYPVLQCEFLNASSRNGEVHLSIGGTPDAHCRIRIMPVGGRFPAVRLCEKGTGRQIRPEQPKARRFVEFEAKGGADVVLNWDFQA